MYLLVIDFKFKILYLTFKCLDGQAPNYLINLITIRRQSRYSLRSNEAPLLVPPSTISTVLCWVIVHCSQLHLVSGIDLIPKWRIVVTWPSMPRFHADHPE